jgi:hypothetical protein
MLSAFPELMKDYTVFKMPAKVGAGYGERYAERTVTGYLSWRKPGEQSFRTGSKVKNQRATFWEQNDLLTDESCIEQGDFIEGKKEILQFVEDDEFGHEGGFTRWALQSLSPFTDRQKRDRSVDLAADFH